MGVRRLAVANGPNIFQCFLLIKLEFHNADTDTDTDILADTSDTRD